MGFQDIKKMKTTTLATEPPSAPSVSPWRTDEPPKDGTPIVAIGKVMYDDGLGTYAEPFTAAITWGSNQFNDIKEGWHYLKDGMSLPSTLEDEVIIHYWLPYPS